MFTLTITLGNEAMQTPEDVAWALRKAIEQLEAGETRRNIRDSNGNTVGMWEFKPDTDGEETE